MVKTPGSDLSRFMIWFWSSPLRCMLERSAAERFGGIPPPCAGGCCAAWAGAPWERAGSWFAGVLGAMACDV